MTLLRSAIRPCLWAVLLMLLFLGWAPAPASAGDVSPGLQAAFETGQRLYAKGDPQSLGEALAALDLRKDEALESIDYWALYARIWIALKKDPQSLWTEVVGPRQAAAPTSVVFDLARARIASTNEEKRSAVEAALGRDAGSVPARVEMARLLIAEGAEDDAAELLEAILEEDEYALGALLVLARLDLSDGLPEDALASCDKALEKFKTADVHHLKALCFQRLARNKPTALKDALTSATEAMGLEPTVARIELYNDLLKQTGDAATAAKALRAHFKRTKHPMLAALLAESAFKAGDYEGAILGLSVGREPDLVTLKALASSHARLGHVAEAQAAADKLMTVDSQGTLFAARIDLYLGDAASARKRLGSLADPRARRLRALAHAWRGEADAVKALVSKEVATGSRAGEALLIAWLQARMLSRMDADLADAVRQKLLEARFRAGRTPARQAVAHSVNLGTARTAGWPRRALTWYRAPCGMFFRSSGEGFGTSWTLGNGKTNTISQSVTGEADCGGERATCSFGFNARESKSLDGWIQLMEEETELESFAPAEKAFAAACKSYVDGKPAAARAGLRKTLEIEPGWSRIKVLLAVMSSLESDDEKRADAREAKAAAEAWPDDFELRRLVIYLRAWAGDAELKEEITALAAREAQYNVRNLAAL